MRLLASIMAAAAAVGFDFVAAQSLGQPGWEFLYAANLTLGELWPIGDYGFGTRVAIPILGGTFEGPRMKGTVSNLGADWAVADSKGVLFADARYNLRTDDGVDILIQLTGAGQPAGGFLVRSTYQTGHPDYEWLNYAITSGVLWLPGAVESSKYTLIDVWQVSYPCLRCHEGTGTKL